MSELWEVVGSSWRMPIEIDWYDQFAEWRYPSIALLKIQFEAIESVMKPISFERSGKTWVCRADLLQVAHISERTNPEAIVEWLPVRPPTAIPEFKESTFIHGYCGSQYAITRDPAIADALWVSFCKYALHWLINAEKPIDLGFAKLIPLFLRRNWSNAAAKWEHRNISRIFKSNFMRPDIDNMVERGVADYLVTDAVTAYDPEHVVPRPCLTVVAGEQFYEASMRRELTRKRRWTARKYWRKFVERLKEQLPIVLEVYAYECNEARYPFCSVEQKSSGGGENKRPGTTYRASPGTPCGHWGEDNTLFPPPIAQGVEGTLRGSDDVMPEVSRVQSESADMRHSGGDLSGSGDGST